MDHPNPSLDPTRYLRPPRINVASGLSLGRMLLAATPDRPRPEIIAAAQTLRVDVDALEAQWKAKGRTRSTADVRPFDHRLDRAWSAIERGLARYTILAPSHPKRVRAAELHARLFPDGLAFTHLPYVEQHAQSQHRLSIIADEALHQDLERLVGPEFVHELQEAHEAYGAALGITQVNEPSPPISLAEPLRALGRSISSYTLQLLAYADLDPEHNAAVVCRALAPIDALRRKQARRSASGSGVEGNEGSEGEPEPDAEFDSTENDDLAEVGDEGEPAEPAVATSA